MCLVCAKCVRMWRAKRSHCVARVQVQKLEFHPKLNTMMAMDKKAGVDGATLVRPFVTI